MWWILFFSVLVFSIGLFLIVYAKQQIKLTREDNEAIEKELRDLTLEKIKTQSDIERNNAIILTQKTSIQQWEETAQNSFELYHKELEHRYQETDQAYDLLYAQLDNAYDNYQDNLLKQMQEKQEELNSISATYKAAKQAQLKEQELKEKEKFYSLSLDEIDLHEAKVLHSIESELRDPRPVRMIIWSTYYSKKANDMAARVLGTAARVIGIYKITNKLSGLCYIGQSKDIRERWREHLKCGIGIDTPSNNRLYQAMLKDGVDNFTFELLEVCSLQELDEKEKFYIQLYQAKEYGYNSTAGNKK